jgi:hypothetical protein
MRLRELNFEKYISPLDSSASKKYSELIINEVKNCKSVNVISKDV